MYYYLLYSLSREDVYVYQNKKQKTQKTFPSVISKGQVNHM